MNGQLLKFQHIGTRLVGGGRAHGKQVLLDDLCLLFGNIGLVGQLAKRCECGTDLSQWTRQDASNFGPLLLFDQRWNLAYLYARQASETPWPEHDLLFVDESVWKWRAKDELSIAAYWTGRYRQSAELCEELLGGGSLPGEQVSRVEQNLDFARGQRGN